MITNVYFVRHAHSIYTPEELERPLSERGEEDAKEVTDLLKFMHIDHVISSPYKRAIQTVEGIARYIGKELEIVEDLRERTLSELPIADFNEAISKVWMDFNYSLNGGESNNVAQKRGVAAILQILDTWKGQNVVIGSHGNIMVLIMHYFDPSYDEHFWEQLTMPDIYRLTFNEEQLIDVHRIVDKEENSSHIGHTIYQAIGNKIDYPHVDLENERMTGTVSFGNKVYMTVHVDLRSNAVEVEGSVMDFAHLTPEFDYIEMFKNMAKFFIENKIRNPKEYYENLISEQTE